MQRVGGFLFLSFRKRRRGIQVVFDVGAATLHEVTREALAYSFISWPGQIGWKVGEVGIEQCKKRTKGVFLAAVRGCRDQDQMSARIGCQPAQKFAALMRGGSLRASART